MGGGGNLFEREIGPLTRANHNNGATRDLLNQFRATEQQKPADSIEVLRQLIKKYTVHLREDNRGTLPRTPRGFNPESHTDGDHRKRITFYIATSPDFAAGDLDQLSNYVLALELKYEQRERIRTEDVINVLKEVFRTEELERESDRENERSLRHALIIETLDVLKLNYPEYLTLLEWFELEEFSEEEMLRVLKDTWLLKAFLKHNSSVRSEHEKLTSFKQFVNDYDRKGNWRRFVEVNLGEIKSPTLFATNAAPAAIADMIESFTLLAASIALDFVPIIGTAKMIIEATGGVDLISGEKLATWQRILIVVPAGCKLGGRAVSGLARGAVRATKSRATAVLVMSKLVLQVPAPAMRMSDRVALVADTLVKTPKVNAKIIEEAAKEIPRHAVKATATGLQKAAAKEVMKWGNILKELEAAIKIASKVPVADKTQYPANGIPNGEERMAELYRATDQRPSNRTPRPRKPRTAGASPPRPSRKEVRILQLRKKVETFLIKKKVVDLSTQKTIEISYINPLCTPRQYRVRLTQLLHYLSYTEPGFPMKFLLTNRRMLFKASGSKMTGSHLYVHPQIVDAGHVISAHTGVPDKIVLMTAWNNRIDLGIIEKRAMAAIQGGFKVRIINNIAIHESSLEAMHLAGLISKEAVASSPLVAVDAL
jgi:hypothetical protein